MTSSDRATARGAVAHHEAGHVVAILQTGGDFRYATLRPRARSVPGLVRDYQPTSRADLGLVLAAGPVAEVAFRQRRGWHPLSPDVTRRAVLAEAEDGGHPEITELGSMRGVSFAATLDHAVELVTTYWPQVEVLAAHLARATRALTARQARALVREVTITSPCEPHPRPGVESLARDDRWTD